MSRRSRNVTITSIAFVAFALVAGCSGEDAAASAGATPAASAAASGAALTGENPADLLARAPGATFEAGTARFEMTLDISAQGKKMTTAGSGSYDFAKKLGTITMDGKAMGAPGTVETILAGDTVYTQLPGEPGWFRMDAAEVGGQQDPTKQLEALRVAASDVQVVGTEAVRGAEARHLTFSLDAKKVAESVGTPEVGAAAGMINGPAPADIWIDSEGRVVKFQVRMSMQQAETNTTIEYFDFGDPLSIEVPDPDEVQDVPAN